MLMQLTVNYNETRFTITGGDLNGSYLKDAYVINKGYQSITLCNNSQPAVIPFILRTYDRFSTSSIVVDGTTYQVDYTDEDTITASLNVIYIVLCNAFNGVAATPANRFEFTTAPSLGDFATALGITLMFPIKIGNTIFFWNKNYVIPEEAFDTSPSVTITTQATDMGIAAFVNNTSLNHMVAPACTNIEGSAFLDCTSATSYEFPAIKTITGSSVFANNTSLTSIVFGPDLTILGEAGGDPTMFNEITGQTIAVTIPIFFQTNVGGDMDKGLDYLNTNNTVTFTWI